MSMIVAWGPEIKRCSIVACCGLLENSLIEAGGAPAMTMSSRTKCIFALILWMRKRILIF